MTRLDSKPTDGSSTWRYRRAFDEPTNRNLLMIDTVSRSELKWNDLIKQLESWRDGIGADIEVDLAASRRALAYAQLLSSIDEQQIPSRVGPTINKGIAFEWENGDLVAHLEILDDYKAEYTQFDGSQLVGDAELEWNENEQTYSAIYS